VVLSRVVLELADTESRSITLGMCWKRAKKAVRSMFAYLVRGMFALNSVRL